MSAEYLLNEESLALQGSESKGFLRVLCLGVLVCEGSSECDCEDVLPSSNLKSECERNIV